MPYISYRDTNESGELLYFIVQKEFPHFQVIVSDTPKKVFVECVPVSGYNLYLVFGGVLRGFMIPSYKNVDEEIKEVMINMSNWFVENRILPNEKKYKKWKIHGTISTK